MGRGAILFRPLCASAPLRETLFLLLFVGTGLGQVRDDFIRTDPAKVMLPEACGECHRSAFALWKTTPHATGYDDLHHKESALEIAKAMGFFLVKRESLCLKCHYTPVVRRDTLRAAAGVSCESCHGAARDWINVHSNYGVQESDFQKARKLETPQHRQERLAKADAAGMLRPSNLYAVASNCFQCHTVPHEELVNVGRHSTGSADFELLSWSQGKIRHNFLESFLTGDGTVNAQRPAPRRRLLYLMGKALDLEYSLRGLAVASEDGRYYKAMRRRYRNALGEMREIASRTSLPELNQMLSALQGHSLNFGNGPDLAKVADAVAQVSQKISMTLDGTQLASLDPLISGNASDRRAASEAPQEGADEASSDSPSAVAADDTKNTPAATPSSGGSSVPSAESKSPGKTSGTDSTAPDRPRRRTVSDVGQILTRPPWRPVLQHRSIGPGVCSGCHDHTDQDEWWLDDKHYTTADRLLDEDAKALQIARFYGISSSQMKRGDQICAQCHGSIVSGRESREVISGVGCESCHGPGEDFKEPHQKDRDRALQLGMIDLKNLKTRAQTCAGCHYINESRLISAGHPTGSQFDLGDRNGKIQHWKHALADPGQLRAAYRQVISARGAIPTVAKVLDLDVPLAQDSQGGTQKVSTSVQSSGLGGSGPSEQLGVQSGQLLNPGGSVVTGSVQSNPSGQPEGSSATSASSGGQTQPEVPNELSVEDALLLIKERLERLYRETRR